MIKATVEYVGFRSGSSRREYVLRSHLGAETHEYTVGIAHTAFTGGRVRFQDGPEICYLKLLRELAAAGDAPATDDFTLTDAELAEYLSAHTPAPRRSGFSPKA
ncbi:MAG: hypothetical protein DMF80_18180 [Acidobacteria bacterium]|nr:MAG: hypothetical protein DMF80_18180 [Acidobacteriota bacterium]